MLNGRSFLFAAMIPVLAACSGPTSEGTGGPGADEREHAGGNSGAEGGSTTSGASCPCDPPGIYLKVAVDMVQPHEQGPGGLLSLRVQEVLHVGSAWECPETPFGLCLPEGSSNPYADWSSPLEPDDELEVTWDGGLPCYFGGASIDVGGEALVAFTPDIVLEPDCGEKAPPGYCCSESEWREAENYAAQGDPTLLNGCNMQCDPSGRLVCRRTDWTRGRVRLTPWADEILLAQTNEGSLTVPAAALDALWSLQRSERAKCYEEYGDFSELPGVVQDGDPGAVTCVYDGQDIPCDAPSVKFAETDD